MPYELKPFDIDVETTPYLNDTASGGGDRWLLNFGPQHPATHTTLRIVLELDGERIVRAVPHIGYLHSGFEKLGEKLDYNQYVTVVSRMEYLSPILEDIAWHTAAEKLFGIELTPRCKVLRTIMSEIGPHPGAPALCCRRSARPRAPSQASSTASMSASTSMTLVDYISGQRFHCDWTRVGGLSQDLPDEKMFKTLVKKFINEQLPPAIDDIERLLNANKIFRDRTEGIGYISTEDAIAWSLSGPMARSANVKRDVRKDSPYLCYKDKLGRPGFPRCRLQSPARNHRRLSRAIPRPTRRNQTIRTHHQAAHRRHPRRLRQCRRRRQDDKTRQILSLRLHRRAHPALRTHHDKP